jgi:hypothetical protein
MENMGYRGYAYCLENGKRFLSRDFAVDFLEFQHLKGLCEVATSMMEENAEFEDQVEVLLMVEEQCPRCQMRKSKRMMNEAMDFALRCSKDSKEWHLQAMFVRKQAGKLVDRLLSLGHREKWDAFLKEQYGLCEEDPVSQMVQDERRSEEKGKMEDDDSDEDEDDDDTVITLEMLMEGKSGGRVETNPPDLITL